MGMPCDHWPRSGLPLRVGESSLSRRIGALHAALAAHVAAGRPHTFDQNGNPKAHGAFTAAVIMMSTTMRGLAPDRALGQPGRTGLGPGFPIRPNGSVSSVGSRHRGASRRLRRVKASERPLPSFLEVRVVLVGWRCWLLGREWWL